MNGFDNFLSVFVKWSTYLNRKQWALVLSSVILGVFLILSYQLKLRSIANEILIELNLEEPEEKEPEIVEEKKRRKTD